MKFPVPYRILAEMDPQNLGAPVPTLELYDLESDPDEIDNLAMEAGYPGRRERLLEVLRGWVKSTNDTALNPKWTETISNDG